MLAWAENPPTEIPDPKPQTPSPKPRTPTPGPDAKELLKKYGSAYLVTSISLSLISFGVCYLLVSQGIDVATLLSK